MGDVKNGHLRASALGTRLGVPLPTAEPVRVAHLVSHPVPYYATLYPEPVPTQIRAMIRIYYPTPGSDTQASILPPPSPLPPPNQSLDASYVFPALQEVD